MRNLVPNPKKGMDLSDFLLTYKEEMFNTRAFYVVEPKIDKGRNIKIGIAGEKDGNSWKRLRDYEITYGKNNSRNQCNGVWIYYCGITPFNDLVLNANSQVRKIETFLKAAYRRQGVLSKYRGTERIEKTPAQILKDLRAIQFKSGMKDEVVDIERRADIKKLSKQRREKLKEREETYNELYSGSDAWLKEQEKKRKQANIPNVKQKIRYVWEMDDNTLKQYKGTVTKVTPTTIYIKYDGFKGIEKHRRNTFIKGKTWFPNWR